MTTFFFKVGFAQCFQAFLSAAPLVWDQEAVGSNPTTPTIKKSIVFFCRSDALPPPALISDCKRP